MKTASLFYCAFCDRAEYAVNFPSAAVLSGREFSSHRRTNCDDFVSSRSRQQCELRVMNTPTPQFNRFQNGGRPPFRICKIKNNSLCNPKGIFCVDLRTLIKIIIIVVNRLCRCCSELTVLLQLTSGAPCSTDTGWTTATHSLLLDAIRTLDSVKQPTTPRHAERIAVCTLTTCRCLSVPPSVA